jgi:hypothetical protein
LLFAQKRAGVDAWYRGNISTPDGDPVEGLSISFVCDGDDWRAKTLDPSDQHRAENRRLEDGTPNMNNKVRDAETDAKGNFELRFKRDDLSAPARCTMWVSAAGYRAATWFEARQQLCDDKVSITEAQMSTIEANEWAPLNPAHPEQRKMLPVHRFSMIVDGTKSCVLR